MSGVLHMANVTIEYLEECLKLRQERPGTFERYNLTGEQEKFGKRWYPKLDYSVNHRDTLVRKYAWAIPTQEALETIARYGSNGIVEIGAGTGYWAYLLQQMGVDVRPYDNAPPHKGNNSYKHNTTWTQVWKGNEGIVTLYSDRALMLCWPPYDTPMAYRALQAYKGDTLIYIGEGEGGCTANDDFHELLHREWNEVESVAIPQWDGIHDYLSIHKRLEDECLATRSDSGESKSPG